MTSWKNAASKALFSGSAASLVSAGVLLGALWLKRRGGVAGLDGREERNGAQGTSSKAAAARMMFHQVVALLLAVLNEKVFSSRRRNKALSRDLLEGFATAALAKFVEQKLSPRRIRPLPSTSLSKSTLTVVYAAFGVGLALTKYARRCLRSPASSPALTR